MKSLLFILFNSQVYVSDIHLQLHIRRGDSDIIEIINSNFYRKHENYTRPESIINFTKIQTLPTMKCKLG